MTEILKKDNMNKRIKYTFRFSASNELVHLTQNQLDRIPYLAAIVEHRNDFLSYQNESGEYLLNPPLHYNWFIPILHYLNSEQPYTLFTELPEDENVLGTLQLFDYLGISPFAYLSLRKEYLWISNPTRPMGHVPDSYSNLSEARNAAAEFVIFISKSEYDFSGSVTMKELVSTIILLLTRTDIFSSRFRHHTLTIIKECCFTFLPRKYQRQLITTHERTQKKRKLNSFVYLYNDNGSLPYDFNPTFPRIIVDKVEISYRRFPTWESFHWLLMETFGELKTQEEIELLAKKHEFQSARSGRFNTLPKRPNIDKYKHRSGPKAQKYR